MFFRYTQPIVGFGVPSLLIEKEKQIKNKLAINF